jgi:HAD superfamily hydrolase (TIGR01549 family)
MQIYAWYVWEKGFEGETTLRWISNKKSLHKAVKALILDFDHTLFNTNADREVRKNSKVKDWDLIFSKISEYKLYDGWREVFNTAKTKGVKIAIISTAKKELIQRTLKHFQLDCDVIIGWQRCYQKPNPKLVEMALKKLQVSKEEVVSIGDSVLDKQMSINCEVRFIGAIWDCEKEESFAELQRGITISSPFEIIDIL